VQSQNFIISRFASVVQCGGETRIGDKREGWAAHGLVNDEGDGRTGCVSRELLLDHGLSGSVQRALLSAEHAFHQIRQILDDMKAIGHLHGSGSTASDSFGEGPSPVAGDELDRGLAFKPGGQTVRCAIW
jgi:hypothetical protein